MALQMLREPLVPIRAEHAADFEFGLVLSDVVRERGDVDVPGCVGAVVVESPHHILAVSPTPLAELSAFEPDGHPLRKRQVPLDATQPGIPLLLHVTAGAAPLDARPLTLVEQQQGFPVAAVDGHGTRVSVIELDNRLRVPAAPGDLRLPAVATHEAARLENLADALAAEPVKLSDLLERVAGLVQVADLYGTLNVLGGHAAHLGGPLQRALALGFGSETGELDGHIPTGDQLPVQDSIDRGLRSPDCGTNLFLGQACIKEGPDGV